MSGIIITLSQGSYKSDNAQAAIEEWENRRAGQGRLSCDDGDHEMVSTLTAEAESFKDELKELFDYCDFSVVTMQTEDE